MRYIAVYSVRAEQARQKWIYNLDYAVIIEPLSAADGGGFLARVPDLPGCFSDGETPEEALAAAQGAIREWIEEARRLGREPPSPKSYALAG